MLDGLAMKFLRNMDAEKAHGLAIKALKFGYYPKPQDLDAGAQKRLRTRVLGMEFANPLGLAAGFDKNAEVMTPMLKAGFGFTEVGSITPLGQPGNDKPRLFRLPADGAVINRMGFNNEGAEAAAKRLAAFRKNHPHAYTGQSNLGPLGVNIGKNKTSDDAKADYATCTRMLAPFADYLVINVSSPNTKGLRALQGQAELIGLLKAVQDARAESCQDFLPPIFVKVAPDMVLTDLADIAEVALNHGLDGLIVSNTTIARPKNLKETALAEETGGLSGQPLFRPSTQVLSEMYRLTEGRVPLIGVGGIASGSEAYAKIRAGASLLQLYSAMALKGPAVISQIICELAQLLEADRFNSVADAVGADHKKS